MREAAAIARITELQARFEVRDADTETMQEKYAQMVSFVNQLIGASGRPESLSIPSTGNCVRDVWLQAHMRERRDGWLCIQVQIRAGRNCGVFSARFSSGNSHRCVLRSAAIASPGYRDSETGRLRSLHVLIEMPDESGGMVFCTEAEQVHKADEDVAPVMTL